MLCRRHRRRLAAIFEDKKAKRSLVMPKDTPQEKKPVCKLWVLTEAEQARMLADSRNKMRWDIESRERAAAERGREEGLEKGLEKVARNALKRGDSIEDIADLTGLSPEQIRALIPH
jgi:predicted transposase/invertase (TIGR01784 family)